MIKKNRSTALELIAEIWEGLKETGRYLLMIARALRFWHRDPPIETVDNLTRFAETRSKFVSQITLFGYIKTRAGTKYTLLFTDEKYAQSINMAKWEIYLACLTDAAVYLAARVGTATGADAPTMEALACHMVETTLAGEEIPKERPHGFDDIRDAFRVRATTQVWAECADGEGAFSESLPALVKWAPIADELKALDTHIVHNSMRFKWKKVRDQADQLLDETAIMNDWRAR